MAARWRNLRSIQIDYRFLFSLSVCLLVNFLLQNLQQQLDTSTREGQSREDFLKVGMRRRRRRECCVRHEDSEEVGMMAPWTRSKEREIQKRLPQG